jgi:hypothetical protein
MAQPYAQLKGTTLVVVLDTMTTTASPSAHLEQLHGDDVAEYVAILGKPGQATKTYLDIIEKQPGWRLLTEDPNARVLEIEVPV